MILLIFIEKRPRSEKKTYSLIGHLIGFNVVKKNLETYIRNLKKPI